MKCWDSQTNCYHNIFCWRLPLYIQLNHSISWESTLTLLRDYFRDSVMLGWFQYFSSNQFNWKFFRSTGQVFVSILDLLIFNKHQDIFFWATKGIDSSSVCPIQVPENRLRVHKFSPPVSITQFTCLLGELNNWSYETFSARSFHIFMLVITWRFH